MSEKYLVVENGLVVNVVVFGGGAWSPSAGQNLVLLTEELRSVDIGWTLVDGVWQPPQVEGEITDV